jgi:hypothetical protein
MKQYIFILFLHLLTTTILFAQKITLTTEQQIENLTELLEDEIEDDQFLQQLQYFIDHPLNLNSATADDLRTLRVITDLQIDNFFYYKKLFGSLINIYELQAVPTWDVTTIRKLLPFVTVRNEINGKDAIRSRTKNGDHILLLRNSRILEQQKGFDKTLPNHYLGSKDRLLLRYKYVYKNLLQYGITGDKDAGEQFLKGAQSKGFDFYSAHFFARQLGKIKSLAIGDFTVNLGQGLVQWQSLAFKKSADVINIKRQAPVLTPYTSAGEYNYNRGVGITVQKNKLELTVFAAHTKINGNAIIDSSTNEEAFSGFLNSGFHRTQNEIIDRYNIDQTSIGGNINFATSFFKIGFNAIGNQFSKPLYKRDEPYNKWAINGNRWKNYSVDYSVTYKNVHFFGEAAMDKNTKKAINSGALISVDPKVDISLFCRNIEPAYQSLYGNAFTENVAPTNENGFYFGLSMRPKPGLRIDAFTDHYKFPWIKFRTDAPGYGRDYLIQFTYQPNKQFELYTRFKNERKSINESVTDSVLNFIMQKPLSSWRVNIINHFSNIFTLKLRTDIVWYKRNGLLAEEGYLAYMEGAYKINSKLSGNLRLQYFETGGFNSRIYAYESDVLYGYSIPAFFDRGMRYYMNLNYDLNEKLTLWVRFAQTRYKNKQYIGSGLDEIEGNTRSELKFQMRIIL